MVTPRSTMVHLGFRSKELRGAEKQIKSSIMPNNMVVVWWCRPHPVREHAQDLRPPIGARPASPPTRQAAQPPPRGPDR